MKLVRCAKDTVTFGFSMTILFLACMMKAVSIAKEKVILTRRIIRL